MAHEDDTKLHIAYGRYTLKKDHERELFVCDHVARNINLVWLAEQSNGTLFITRTSFGAKASGTERGAWVPSSLLPVVYFV